MEHYLPVIIMFVIALAFALVFISLSWLLGPKKPTQTKLSVYECGHNPVGSARERFGVKFYLVAILFIIFDIEVVFLYPWVLNYKDSLAQGNGLTLLAIMGPFFLMLIMGLIYEWKSGVLDWSKKAK